MGIYIIVTILSVVINVIIEKLYGFKKHKALKMFISILPLTILSAVRYDVGWDYLNIYTMGFYMVGKYKVAWFTEGLFRLIIKILYLIFGNPISLFILFSILISLFFSLCFSNYGKIKNVYVYIILFVITRYYFCSLNIMRQALAMLIVLYSLKYIANKKFLKYLLCILLAGGFHFTSYIFIPLYFILGKNIKIKKYAFFSTIIVPILIVISYIFITQTKYVKYFSSMFGNDGTIYYSELLITSILVTFGLFTYKKIKNDNILQCMFNMEFIALILSLLSFALPTGDRIIWLFSTVNLFYIPRLFDLCNKNRTKLFSKILVYLTLILVFFMQSVYTDSYSVLPYQNIWQVKNK